MKNLLTFKKKKKMEYLPEKIYKKPIEPPFFCQHFDVHILFPNPVVLRLYYTHELPGMCV